MSSTLQAISRLFGMSRRRVRQQTAAALHGGVDCCSCAELSDHAHLLVRGLLLGALLLAALSRHRGGSLQTRKQGQAAPKRLWCRLRGHDGEYGRQGGLKNARVFVIEQVAKSPNTAAVQTAAQRATKKCKHNRPERRRAFLAAGFAAFTGCAGSSSLELSSSDELEGCREHQGQTVGDWRLPNM